MKNMAVVVFILFTLSFFFLFEDSDITLEDNNKYVEDRAIYFSYIEFSKYITGFDDITQRKNIIEVLDNIKNLGFNRIIVHVRPFSDSMYESNYYPISKYILNDKGDVPSYDVLEFFINEAHKRNIKFEAWINPYRVSNLNDESLLTDYSSKTDSGIYLNPAKTEVQELIVDGIVEIVENYDVDGIHFDDYFYPDKKIDLDDYKEYVVNGGKLSIEEFRYNNVKNLIKNVYSSIKKINKNVLFGIAPVGNIDNCYNESFLDIKYILSHSGYVDYIMPQIYYGFYNETRPFKETIDYWNSLIKSDIKLIPALAIYKSGSVDKYAHSGKNEWIENTDIIKREILYSRGLSNYSGFSLFSYNYIFNKEYLNDHNKKEIDNIKRTL